MQAITNTDRNLEVRVFDSVTELIDHALATDAQSTRNREQLEGGSGFDKHLTRKDFIGRRFQGLEELRQSASGRWTEGIELIESMLSDVRDATLPEPKTRRRRTRFSEVDGAELDYDRLRSGQEFWRTSRREDSTAPATLTLSVDLSASWQYTPEEIIWRGVAAIVLVERLEAAGYRVELWAHKRSRCAYTDRTGLLAAVCLKSLSDVLDISTLVNAVSGWFYRTVMFSEITQSHDGRRVRETLGTPQRTQPKELHEITHDPETLIIEELWERQDALTFVRSTLAKFAN